MGAVESNVHWDRQMPPVEFAAFLQVRPFPSFFDRRLLSFRSPAQTDDWRSARVRHKKRSKAANLSQISSHFFSTSTHKKTQHSFAMSGFLFFSVTAWECDRGHHWRWKLTHRAQTERETENCPLFSLLTAVQSLPSIRCTSHRLHLPVSVCQSKMIP